MRIFAQAPGRLSLFGGGTDIPPYKNGFVINMTINLHSKLILFTDDDLYINNKFPYNADPKLFYNILEEFGLGGMHHAKIESTSDAFIKSGLGTSGSAGVALIKAIDKYESLRMTREEIAEKAFEIESKLWICGKQDIYASVYGGMNMFMFGNNVKITPIERNIAENIKKHLFLFYIDGEKQQQPKSLTNLDKIKEIALEATKYLNAPQKIGELLNKSWEYKKKSNSHVSNKKIDSIYKLGMEAGAWGGKICGSGGGGYMIFMTDNHDKLVKGLKVKGIEEVDFDIDYQGVEARIL